MSLTSSLLTLAVAVLLTVSATLAQEAPKFDFTQAPDRQGWQAAHDVGPLEGNAAGLVVSITGSDPYIIGPARDYPAGVPLWLHLRLKSEQAGTGQVFYFHDAPTEENSVHFPAQAGVWQEVRLPLPALGPGYHLRLDPPGTSGQAIISSIRSEPRVLLQEPTWPAPITPLCLSPTGKTLSLQSSELSLIHGTGGLGDFRVNVAGKPMAAGFHHFLIGYMMGKTVRWIDALNATQNSRAPEIRATRRSLQAITNLRDPDGALWQFRQNFTPGKITGTIDVVTEVTVDHDREVVFLPMFMLLPGVQSFGESKGQGLFAGLEYLDNEPSSSEADIIGPASRRQVPDSLKITLPLMAIQADNRYVGLSWEAQPTFSAVFDSPDRLFKSQGHVMGVLFPGSDGTNRVEGNLLPYQGELLKSKRPLTLRATIMGGRGNSVISAMQQYVQMRGLPPVPNIGMSQQDYVALAAGGWLDSKIREGDTFRHAYWPGFEPHPAADAPMLMEWLAHQTTDAQLAARLHQVAQSALAKVGPQDYNFAAISHVTYPAPALIYGYVEENAARAEESARNTLKQFTPDGRILYQVREGHPNYGKTHFAPDANGLTAQAVWSVLDGASISGNRELIEAGLRQLRALDKFTNTAPRGAQTWEVPLHTPDILASAYLVRAYTRGYELTGDQHFLDQARYWAWTGVPFIYLINPIGQRVGLYGTIAVLGATNWQAPVWMGLPVQWCGLVYSDALYRLLPYDSTGPWQRLADGITATGIQFTWPRSDTARQGLLPDSYVLRPQLSDGPAINPGTVQTNAIRLLKGPVLYGFHAFRTAGLLLHAPSAITVTQEDKQHIAFSVHGWIDQPYYLLLNGFNHAPHVRINGQAVSLSTTHQYNEDKGRLVLRVQGNPTIEISLT